MRNIPWACYLALIFAIPPFPSFGDELQNPNSRQIELLYKYYAHETPDFYKLATESNVYKSASEFDRANVEKAEEERLRAEFQRYSKIDSVSFRVNSSLTEYEGSRGGFGIQLFQPGIYVDFGTYGAIFDNYDDFVFWNVPVERAKALVAGNRNWYDRQVLLEIRAKPLGIDYGDRHQVRFFAERVRLSAKLDFNQKQAYLGELVAKSTPISISQPKGSALSSNEYDILGLKIGSTKEQFITWADQNNFSQNFDEVIIAINKPPLDKETDEILSRNGLPDSKGSRWPKDQGLDVFFTTKTNRNALTKLLENAKNGINAKYTPGSSFYTNIGRSFDRSARVNEFEFLGALDCQTNVANEQKCGRVTFRPDESGKLIVTSVFMGQSVYATPENVIIDSLKSKYKAPIETFNVDNRSNRVLDQPLKEFAWGQSGASDVADKMSGCSSLGTLKRNWSVEAVIYQDTSDRIFLFTQLCKIEGQGKAPIGAIGPKL